MHPRLQQVDAPLHRDQVQLIDLPGDGIRDLVRSRGLGDVYKRQLGTQPNHHFVPTQLLKHIVISGPR